MDGTQQEYEKSQRVNLEVQTVAQLQSLYNSIVDDDIKTKIKEIINDRLDSIVTPKVVS